MNFPDLTTASRLEPGAHRLMIGAYGFEERSLGWARFQNGQGAVVSDALVFRYVHPKGRNRIQELHGLLSGIGASNVREAEYDMSFPHDIERTVGKVLHATSQQYDEVIFDISAMTKLLILVCLCHLKDFAGTVRIVYSQAEDYSPSEGEYQKSKKNLELIATYPSRGSQSIVRTRCLSSIRMQGQPVSMVAFTSFNEQLVRHMLGTINPHRLIFINGKPPRTDYKWRERATQEIFDKLLEQYRADNQLDEAGLLKRTASTIDYRETVYRIDEIHKQYGTYERIICAATGSKMQTVGLFFSKMVHSDVHIEYPTPDSYFVKGFSVGIRDVHEIVLPKFSDFLRSIQE